MLQGHLCFIGETCQKQKKAALNVFTMWVGVGGRGLYFGMVVFLSLIPPLSANTHIHEANILLPPEIISLLISGNRFFAEIMVAEREGHSIAHTTQASSYQLLWARLKI